jgi:hypothetical protein
MNKINVQSLNEYFNVCGDDFIWIDDTSISTNWNNIPWNTGTKGLTTNSPLQRQIARENTLKRNEKYKGENNPRAKTWRIVYTDGKEIVVKALQRWAVDNGYSASGIKNIAYGKWKTYKDLVRVEEIGPLKVSL